MWHLLGIKPDGSKSQHVDSFPKVKAVSDELTYFWLDTEQTEQAITKSLENEEKLIENARSFDAIQNKLYEKIRYLPVKFGYFKEEPCTPSLKKVSRSEIDDINDNLDGAWEYGLKVYLRLEQENLVHETQTSTDDGFNFMQNKLKEKKSADRKKSTITQLNNKLKALIPTLPVKASRYMPVNEVDVNTHEEVVNLALLTNDFKNCKLELNKTLNQMENSGAEIDWLYEEARTPQSFCNLTPEVFE